MTKYRSGQLVTLPANPQICGATLNEDGRSLTPKEAYWYAWLANIDRPVLVLSVGVVKLGNIDLNRRFRLYLKVLEGEKPVYVYLDWLASADERIGPTKRELK